MFNHLPPLSGPVDASEEPTLTLNIKTKRNMPAFAGYVAGSVKTGRAEILLNIDALLWASVEADESGEFRRATIDSLAHEFIHAMEEHFGLLFDEEKVEAAIARVRGTATTTPNKPDADSRRAQCREHHDSGQRCQLEHPHIGRMHNSGDYSWPNLAAAAAVPSPPAQEWKDISVAQDRSVLVPVVTDAVTDSAARFKKLFVPITYEPCGGDTLAVRMCKKIYNLTALAKFHSTPIGPDELRTINSAAFAGLEGDDEIALPPSPPVADSPTDKLLKAFALLMDAAYRKEYGDDVACLYCGVVVHVPPGTAKRFTHDPVCPIVAADSTIRAFHKATAHLNDCSIVAPCDACLGFASAPSASAGAASKE